MRPARVAVPLVAALAAACNGGQSGASGPSWAGHPGVYSATVVTRLLHPHPGFAPGPPQRIWVDTATGRFRVAIRSPHGFAALSVYDGRLGTQAFGVRHRTLTAYHGSAGFVAEQLGGIGLRVVQSYLTGASSPSGVRVRVLSDGPPARLVATTPTERLRITVAREPAASAGLFRVTPGRASETVRQLHPGASPGAAIPAYWVGPQWDGHPARTSSAVSGDTGSYSVGYPHLAVQSTTLGAGHLAGAEPVTLADGTSATLQVVQVGPDGTATANGGATIGSGAVTLGFEELGGRPGSTVAFVFLPAATVTLSGTVVTPDTAATIARSLRPL